MMLKDYSAPVRQLLYTAMGSLQRNLAYTIKLFSWAFYTDMLAVWGSYTCRFKYGFTLQIVFYVCKKNWTVVSLTLVLQVFLFIPNNTPVSLKVECNFLTPCVFLNLLVSDEKKEKEKKREILLVFRVHHSLFGNDFMSTAQ